MRKLQQAREKANLTRAQLAERAACSRRHVCYLETGKVKSPRIDTLRRLAAALGVEVSDLI